MRKFLLGGLVLTSLMLAGYAEVVPRTLEDAFLQATPANRAATRELWLSKYAGVPDELRNHLEAKYPELDLKVARALNKVAQQHPGLVLGAARHLLEDLGDEPAVALLDVGDAVVARYPDITRLEKSVPELPDGFVAKLLERLPTGLGISLRKTVVDTVQARHAALPEQVFHTVLTSLSRSERRGLWQKLRRGERPAVALWRENPALALRLARKVQQQHGAELRATVIDVLAAMEKDQAARLDQAAQAALGLVESDYPALPGQLRAARRERRAELLREYPELMGVVASTMQERHPQLVARALTSLETHYPRLKAEVWRALEGEMPGVQAEIRGFLDGRYPALYQDLESTLRGVGPTPPNP